LRQVLLIATALVFGVTGAAYAAVSNVYVVSGKITPVKSGTRARPVSVATTIGYTVSTQPKGERPNVVKTVQITIQDVRANTNAFKACGTSRLNNPKEGPATCPKGSLVGRGYFIAEVGPSKSQKTVAATCRAELGIYNRGDRTLSYYVYGAPTVTKTGECPLAPLAFAATVRDTSSGLVETIKLPSVVRHPTAATDASLTKAVVSVTRHTTKVKGKKVGLLESFGCPVNHQREIKVKFTLESGKSVLSTLLLPCR